MENIEKSWVTANKHQTKKKSLGSTFDNLTGKKNTQSSFFIALSDLWPRAALPCYDE